MSLGGAAGIVRPPAGVRARALAAGVALMLGLAGPAAAQGDAPEAPAEEPAGASGLCIEINARAYEATLVIRQHASALSAGFEPDARPQAQQMLAWLDQWTGRLRSILDLAAFSQCLDEGDEETYRRALVVAQRVANQTRDDLLRPARTPQRPRR